MPWVLNYPIWLTLVSIACTKRLHRRIGAAFAIFNANSVRFHAPMLAFTCARIAFCHCSPSTCFIVFHLITISIAGWGSMMVANYGNLGVNFRPQFSIVLRNHYKRTLLCSLWIQNAGIVVIPAVIKSEYVGNKWTFLELCKDFVWVLGKVWPFITHWKSNRFLFVLVPTPALFFFIGISFTALSTIFGSPKPVKERPPWSTTTIRRTVKRFLIREIYGSWIVLDSMHGLQYGNPCDSPARITFITLPFDFSDFTILFPVNWMLPIIW